MINKRATYKTAGAYCESHVGGASGNQPGWLVSILDDSTEKFVKNLLMPDQKAFIGLSKIGDKFVWDDKRRPDSGYRRWKTDHPETPFINSYDYVAVTKDGWETVRNDPSLGFVCEMSPALAAPTMLCPPCEEGKLLLPIKCIVHSLNSYGLLKEIEINGMKSPSVLCRLGRCIEYENNTKAMLSNKTNQWKTTVEVNRQASRSDDGVKWSCSAEFERTSASYLSARCTRHTFVTPKYLDCKKSISVRNGVSVTCDVLGVFPTAGSIWSLSVNGNLNRELEPHKNHTSYTTKDGLQLFNTKFTKMFADPGQHKLKIIVYANFPSFNNEEKHKAHIFKEQTVEFDISVPDKPPVFLRKNGDELGIRLAATVSETVTLVCRVNGGNPQVYETSVECDSRDVKDVSGETSWKGDGQEVSFELKITKAMDQKVCKCKAKHVSKQYLKEAILTINVEHAAEIVNFKVMNEVSNEVEVNVSKRVSFRCDARSNPPPEMRLYKLDSEDKTQKHLKNVNASKYISFDIAKATCDTSGTYVCTAANKLNTKITEVRVDLRVRCPPQPCSNREGSTEFSITPGKAFNFRLCMFVYPEPNPDKRISPKKEKNLNKKDYKIVLEYIDTLKTKAYAVVNMSASVTKLGNYTIKLYQSKWHYIDFSLVPNQKPTCPASFNSKLIGSRFITLTWQPASDRGIPQTFTVKTIDKTGNILDNNDIEGDGDRVMSYNVTNLDPFSVYKFQLGVTNAEGVTECPHQTINVTTQALPVSNGSSDKGVDRTVVGAVVAISVILVIIIVLALVFVKRKRGTDTKETINDANQTRQSVHCKDQNDESQPIIGDVYATVNKPKKTIEAKPDSIYNNEVVLEMHTDQKRSKTDFLETCAQQSGLAIESSVYANTALPSANNDTRDQPSPGGDVTKKDREKSSKQKKSKPKKQTTKKSEARTNMAEPPRGMKNKEDRQNRELVYVEVEIVSTQDKLVAKPAESAEPVDYASLNFQGASTSATHEQ